jgi:hypothetical protein
VIDRWIGRVEDSLIAGGCDESSDDFDEKVRSRLDEDLDQVRLRLARHEGPTPQEAPEKTRPRYD